MWKLPKTYFSSIFWWRTRIPETHKKKSFWVCSSPLSTPKTSLLGGCRAHLRFLENLPWALHQLQSRSNLTARRTLPWALDKCHGAWMLSHTLGILRGRLHRKMQIRSLLAMIRNQTKKQIFLQRNTFKICQTFWVYIPKMLGGGIEYLCLWAFCMRC